MAGRRRKVGRPRFFGDEVLPTMGNPGIAACGEEKQQPMSKATPATRALAAANVPFSVHSYDYDADAGRIGLQAASELGEDPARVLKTLMASVDGKPVCVIVPSDQEISMKKLAAAFDGKAAQMMKPADAERIAGYKVGGISPFGQRRQVRTAIERRALAHDYVYLNGGQRGLQVKLSPADAQAAAQAIAADLIA